MLSSERAWLATEYLSGRTQRLIAKGIRRGSATVCIELKLFCDEWSGVRVMEDRIYSDERKKCLCRALKNYLRTNGAAIKKPADPKEPYAMVLGNKSPRHEHAWLLRVEGKTYKEIGERLGVSKTRAGQMIAQFSRVMGRALRRVIITTGRVT